MARWYNISFYQRGRSVLKKRNRKLLSLLIGLSLLGWGHVSQAADTTIGIGTPTDIVFGTGSRAYPSGGSGSSQYTHVFIGKNAINQWHYGGNGGYSSIVTIGADSFGSRAPNATKVWAYGTTLLGAGSANVTGGDPGAPVGYNEFNGYQGYHNTILGSQSTISYTNNLVAIGSHITTTGSLADGLLIGAYSNQIRPGYVGNKTDVNGIALGSYSVYTRDKGDLGDLGTMADVSSSTWVSTRKGMSIGDSNNNYTRQIVNVAAGTQETNVVNVGQLKRSTDLIVDVNGATDYLQRGESTGETLSIKGSQVESTVSTPTAGITDVGLNTVSSVSADSITFNGSTVKLVKTTGINGGNKQISNAASGIGNDTNAATIGDTSTLANNVFSNVTVINQIIVDRIT